MRLFVAIDLSALVAAAALDLISQLQSTAAAVAPQSRITWMTIDRLHVTIRFIGQVDAAKTDAAKFRGAAIFYGLALLIMLAAIPWPGMPAGRPLIRGL